MSRCYQDNGNIPRSIPLNSLYLILLVQKMNLHIIIVYNSTDTLFTIKSSINKYDKKYMQSVCYYCIP